MWQHMHQDTLKTSHKECEKEDNPTFGANIEMFHGVEFGKEGHDTGEEGTAVKEKVGCLA